MLGDLFGPRWLDACELVIIYGPVGKTRGPFLPPPKTTRRRYAEMEAVGLQLNSPRRRPGRSVCVWWLSETMRMPVTIWGSMAITVSMAMFTHGCSSCS
jgi:hypothetical protein